MQTDADARAGRLRETQTDSAERRLKASLAAPRLTQALPCPRPRLMAERRTDADGQWYTREQFEEWYQADLAYHWDRAVLPPWPFEAAQRRLIENLNQERASLEVPHDHGENPVPDPWEAH